MNIVIVGKLSHGKSSFINAFYCAYLNKILNPIANVAIQKETHTPICYTIDTYSDINYNYSSKSNKYIRKNDIKQSQTIIYKKIAGFSKNIASITEFPDSEFDNLNVYDLIFYVFDIAQFDLEVFNKLKNNVEKLNSKGIFCQLCGIATKYDIENDPELLELFNQLPVHENIQFYRWSSYNIIKYVSTILFVDCIPDSFQSEYNKIQRFGNAEEIGDLFKLRNFLENDILGEKRDFSKKQIINRLDKLQRELHIENNQSTFINCINELQQYKYEKGVNNKLIEYYLNTFLFEPECFVFNEEKIIIYFLHSGKTASLFNWRKLFQRFEFKEIEIFKELFTLYNIYSFIPRNIELISLFTLFSKPGQKIIIDYSDYKFRQIINGFNYFDKFQISETKILDWCLNKTEALNGLGFSSIFNK